MGCDGGGDGDAGKIGKPWGRGGAVGKKSGAMGKNSIGGTPSFMAANSDANALMEAFMNKRSLFILASIVCRCCLVTAMS